MEKTICEICSGPVVKEDGNYICAICGKNYGHVPDTLSHKANFNRFFQNASLETLRKISNRLSSSVANHDRIYVLAVLSNGQFYTRFVPCPGYHSVYRGQCAAERWFGVEKIYKRDSFTIGITYDGELQPTLIPIQEMLDRVKQTGISDMRMKQVLKAEYAHCSRHSWGDLTYEDEFLGLDINGKVVIHNPFAIFGLSPEKPEEVQKCGQIIQDIKKWPKLEALYHFEDYALCGITEHGDVVFVPYKAAKADLLSTVRSWTNVASIDYYYPSSLVSHHKKSYIALKKDGTLISNVDYPFGKWVNLAEITDVVQFRINEIGHFAYIRRNGDLFAINRSVTPELVDHNVVAFIKRGYIKADGTVYELDDKMSLSFKQVPNLVMFDNIETIEEEWRTTAETHKRLKQDVEKEKQQMQAILQEKKAIMESLEAEKTKYGLFQLKEKKALSLQIDEVRNSMGTVTLKIRELDQKLLAFPDGKPVWHPSGTTTVDIVSMEQLSAATRQSIAVKPNKDRSVVKDAAMGALIAGPAGAVVGAIYAVDKNQKNRKQ